MTQSELEKWAEVEYPESYMNSYFTGYMMNSLATTARKDGFLHAIEILRAYREECDNYPYQSCTFGDLIARLKQYAGVK